MSRTVFLDAGPLGILTNPQRPPETVRALRWALTHAVADALDVHAAVVTRSERMARTDTPTYDQLLAQASRLPPADQLRLLEGLAALVRQQIAPAASQSVTALRGLGKEIWQGIDAQEYVNQERAAWNG